MKKQLLVCIAAASLMASTPFAIATGAAKTGTAPDKTAVAVPGDTPILVSKVIQNLESKGYLGLRELELAHDVYQADVVTAQGDAINVKVNAMTGEVMGSKAMPNHLSILDIVKKVEEAGYRITKIKAEGETYKVRALDKEGKKAALKVNAMRGEISKKWFD